MTVQELSPRLLMLPLPTELQGNGGDFARRLGYFLKRYNGATFDGRLKLVKNPGRAPDAPKVPYNRWAVEEVGS